jgi:YbbR domain-containing protein
VRTLTLPVEIEVQGEVATGYRTGNPAVSPDQVFVTGTESLLDQVVAVTGSLDVEGARENVSELVVVGPVDAEGRLVPGLQWAPDRVEVEIELRRKIGFKPDLEVVPDLRGEPAPDYRLGSVTVEPSTVTLGGLPSVLEELPGFVETWPISVTDATEDLVEYSPLKVPEGVAVVGFDYVTITVEVLPIESSRAMTSAIETQGVRPGLIATPSPSVVDVILEGPNTILSALTADDIRVILNLFDYSVGVHRVEPDVVAPDGVLVVSVIPETIEVVIAPSPTPTPTLTVTATVTAEP